MRYVYNTYNFNISSAVKALIITNGIIWFSLVVVLQGLFFDQFPIFHILGLSAQKVFFQYWLWQILTYFFVHSSGIFHILFNMFALWMFGSELEKLWGPRFFLIYYIFCGLGAGLIYLLCLFLGVFFFQTDPALLATPMVGASGAIFGILFAYGWLFSERVILFMLIFPIKARYFTLIIALVEFVSLINSGMGSPISHLAHLSGFVAGFLFLQIWKFIQNFNIRQWKKRPVHLKILKNRDKERTTTWN